jgi:D-alanyl-D-alanine carboxypeptidase/D-alanyl-D-alanine-endopeptidase (penicillin-binding protein 4)
LRIKIILMKKIILVAGCWLLVDGSFAQSVSQKLQTAFQQFESDSQLKHAISSLYVIDAKTGNVIFDKNSQVGLADASTQKIITAATAFELLGKDYRYKTEFGYTGETNKDTLKGDLFLRGSGDPTLGSWRYESAKDSSIFYEWLDALKILGIKNVRGRIDYDTRRFSAQIIPDGWIWQDIGNYYGAAPGELNWREDQFDIILRSGNKIGSEVEVVSPNWRYTNELRTAGKGTGDNAYAYFYNGEDLVIAGTIPVGESSFKISAANPYPTKDLIFGLGDFFVSKGIIGRYLEPSLRYPNYDSVKEKFQLINTHYSPSLDSIIYWFFKKSINLYGEALIKTFAYEKQGFGSTDSGVAIVKDFWKQKGIDEDELNICDGSGLSPLNRVTTHSQVEILKYAKAKDWFRYFYDALPEYNGMKMKSGTIRDVKAFCGYQTAKDGNEYIFSFIINNYNGYTSEVVSKMYKVLDNLK